MQHYSVKPLHVVLRPSRLLALSLGGACVSAAVLISLLPLPLWAQGLCLLVVICATAYHFSRHVWLRLPQSITALEVGGKGEFRCFTRASAWCDAVVLGSSFVTPQLTVLNLRLPHRRLAQHVVLLPDALESDAFRRLRVWLRWGQAHEN